jgi:molybdate transport repressor ModE-like protein
MTVHTSFDASWLAGEALPREHGRDLVRLLAALERSSSLRDAARVCGLSYRHAWGLIGEGARALGGALVDMGRGRGARLTALGRRVLDADRHVRAALDPVFERLRAELRGVLAGHEREEGNAGGAHARSCGTAESPM